MGEEVVTEERRSLGGRISEHVADRGDGETGKEIHTHFYRDMNADIIVGTDED